MKKYLFITLGLLFTATNLCAQNVVIQQNTTSESSSNNDPNAYYINGISTREDIGGVEMRWVYTDGVGRTPEFTNYNQFSVYVIYEIDCKTGTIVLQGYETKRIKSQHYREEYSYKLIARRLSGQ